MNAKRLRKIDGSKEHSLQLVPMTWHRFVRRAALHNRLVAILGDPGTGKSHFAQHLVEELSGRPPVVMYGSPVLDAQEIWGRWVLVGSEMRFVNGKLVQAILENRWLIWEEFAQTPVAQRMALLGLRQGERSITNIMSGETLLIPDNWRCLICGNIETTRCRKGEGMRALFSDMIVVHAAFDQQLAAEILRSHAPAASSSLIARVVEMWLEYRRADGRETAGDKPELTIRAALHLLTLLMDGDLSESQCIELALVNAYLPLDEDKWTAQQLKLGISA